jgi:hypothetical protein
VNMRAWSRGELAMLRENSLDSDQDMSQMLSRPVSEVRSKRAELGLLTGKALDVARKQAEADPEWSMRS